MIALVVSTTAADVELASDALWSLGVVAIEERAAGNGVELWTSLGDDSDAVIAVSQRLEQWSWHFVEVDETVADTWRSHAEPVWIDQEFVICPAWIPLEAESAAVTVVRIEPGATFGLGDHPTTMLSMRAIRRSLSAGSTVLDVGCGSGVLAVGACVLGASLAVAIDISPAAVPITKANAETNGVAYLVEVSTTSLSQIDRQFDVVVANILAPALIDMAADLVRVVAPSGVLIISGLLATRHEHVEAALQPLRRIRRDTLDGWAAITLAAGRPPIV